MFAGITRFRATTIMETRLVQENDTQFMVRKLTN